MHAGKERIAQVFRHAPGPDGNQAAEGEARQHHGSAHQRQVEALTEDDGGILSENLGVHHIPYQIGDIDIQRHMEQQHRRQGQHDIAVAAGIVPQLPPHPAQGSSPVSRLARHALASARRSARNWLLAGLYSRGLSSYRSSSAFFR